MSKNDFPYLHGFSKKEQDRLRGQARFAEYSVYQNVNFSGLGHILEVGCGVGAQSEILLRRFPDLKLTGIDLNDKQLDSARESLGSNPLFSNRYNILKMDAGQMDFKSNEFEGAFLCWILEHVKNPARVLSEVRRVLRPGSPIYITEVMNSSFFLEPYSPNVWKYWMAFNDFQHERAGDPFIGAKLGNLLSSIGFVQIQTEVKTWHFDNRWPGKRKECIEYWTELLLSAADLLVAEKLVTSEEVELARNELDTVKSDPNAVFLYSFFQAKAIVP